jgi:hypothetical protein
LFREDNSAVCHKLEEATRATSHAASVKPFQRAKNGREAWLALSSQHAGQDKWEAEIKRHEQLLHTRKWTAQSNFDLERFVAQHRNAHVSMQAAAEHVAVQLPNERSRVGHLLGAIQCSDAGVQAAMASISIDQGPTGMRNNFEAAATHLLPYDPVQKKKVDQAVGKRGAADISDVAGDEGNTSSFGTKKGSGASGVPLRYHTKQEYDLLDKKQKDELREWRKSSAFKGDKRKKGKKPEIFDAAKAVASAVEKKAAEKLKAMELEKTEETDTEAYVMALINKCAGKAGKAQASQVNFDPPPRLPTLKSILKKAKKDSKADA